MSPSSLCDATVQPPAQTGMNAQSWHCFQAESRSNCCSAWLRYCLLTPVDVADRLQRLAGEAGAGEERSIRANRVRVRMVDLARTHVHAVAGREPALLRLVPQERHLLVDEVARVADAVDARARRRHARAVQRLAFRANHGQRNQALPRPASRG